MSVHAREYEGSLVAQTAEKLYSGILQDIKAAVKSSGALSSADAKKISVLAVSHDPAGFEKKGIMSAAHSPTLSYV